MTQMSTALAVVVLPVLLAVQGEVVSLCVSPCALCVAPLGLVWELLSGAYGPDLAARRIHVDDSGPLWFVGSGVALCVDCIQLLAHM